MACQGAELYVGAILLVLSEALPFIRRYLKWDIPADGLAWIIFYLLFRSKCMDVDQVHKVEKALGKDIDGDGHIGSPPTSEQESEHKTETLTH